MQGYMGVQEHYYCFLKICIHIMHLHHAARLWTPAE